MRPHLFFILAILLLVPCASATVINTTVLLTTNYGGDVHLGTAQSQTGQYLYSPPENNMIIFSTFYPKNEGQSLNWILTRNGGSDITGSVRIESTGLFSGNTIATINGGSTSTVGYSKVVLLKYNPPMTMFYVKSDTAFYLVIADNSRFNYAVSGDIYHPVYAPFLLDTDIDCYLQLSETPTTYPVTRLTVNPSSSGEYTVTPYYESIQAAEQAEIDTTNVQQSVSSGGTLSFLTSLVNLVLNAVKLLDGLSKSIGSFVSVFGIILAFIFAAEIFIGLNALYIAIAILLAIEDSDDIFKAFGAFYRRMMKLFRFYMELFRAMKDILKWW